MSSRIERNTFKGKVLITLSLTIAIILIGAFLFMKSASVMYKIAIHDIETNQYSKAVTLLELVGDYRDSREILKKTYYDYADRLYLEGKFADSKECFIKADGYSDSEKRISETDIMSELQGGWRDEKDIDKALTFDEVLMYSENFSYPTPKDFCETATGFDMSCQGIQFIDSEKGRFIPSSYIYGNGERLFYAFYFELCEDGKIHQFTIDEASGKVFETAVLKKTY